MMFLYYMLAAGSGMTANAVLLYLFYSINPAACYAFLAFRIAQYLFSEMFIETKNKRLEELLERVEKVQK